MKKQKQHFDPLQNARELAKASMKQTIEALSKPQKVFFPKEVDRLEN